VHGPVAVAASILFLFHTRLVKAVCWNLLLRAMGVPIQERQSIVTQVARQDLGVASCSGCRGKSRISSATRVNPREARAETPEATASRKVASL
jgi:hypothetical protein